MCSGRTLSFLAAVIVAGSSAWAAGIPPAQSRPESHARLSLLSEQSVFDPGKPISAAVRFQLDPGWHIYWQNPGDSGTPPKIGWILPPGFTAGAVKWPRPMRLCSGSVIDYGYQNDVLLMASVKTPASASGAAMIGADVRYVVCREICIPGKAELTLSIPASADHEAHFSDSHALFEMTRKELPKAAPASWKPAAQSAKDDFVLAIHGLPAMDGITFFPVGTGIIDNPAPQIVSSIPGGFTLTLKKSELLTGRVSALKGLLNVPGRGTFEITARVVRK